jgi:sugar lactone lactonase YvrE
LNTPTSAFATIAGGGGPGSASTQLNSPSGIFVTSNFQLYVADCTNNRIQRFQLGNLTGTTVSLNGLTGSNTLSCPTGVVMDADGYLFILDSSNNRIVGSNANGFRCVAACSATSGSTADKLSSAWSLSFDNLGNIFVADSRSSRIQKFLLATNTCGKNVTCFFFFFSLPTSDSTPIFRTTDGNISISTLEEIGIKVKRVRLFRNSHCKFNAKC